jgi:hypothetical protein
VGCEEGVVVPTKPDAAVGCDVVVATNTTGANEGTPVGWVEVARTNVGWTLLVVVDRDGCEVATGCVVVVVVVAMGWVVVAMGCVVGSDTGSATGSVAASAADDTTCVVATGAEDGTNTTLPVVAAGGLLVVAITTRPWPPGGAHATTPMVPCHHTHTHAAHSKRKLRMAFLVGTGAEVVVASSVTLSLVDFF